MILVILQVKSSNVVVPPFSLFVSSVHFITCIDVDCCVVWLEERKRCSFHHIQREKGSSPSSDEHIHLWYTSQKTEFLFETINWNYELATCFMVLTACCFDIARFISLIHIENVPLSQWEISEIIRSSSIKRAMPMSLLYACMCVCMRYACVRSFLSVCT